MYTIPAATAAPTMLTTTIAGVDMIGTLSWFSAISSVGSVAVGAGLGELETGLEAGELETGLEAGELETGLEAGELETGLEAGELVTGLEAGELVTGLEAVEEAEEDERSVERLEEGGGGVGEGGGVVGERLVGEIVVTTLEHASNVYPEGTPTNGTTTPSVWSLQSGLAPEVHIAYTTAFAELHDVTLPLPV
jgi:hypothetical protein